MRGPGVPYLKFSHGFVKKGITVTDKCTPGPRIMRIHLVRYSTSARFEKNPQIFT